MADRLAGHGLRAHARGPHPRTVRKSGLMGHADTTDSAPGICRICRGEATPEEPLFYPCKCSGSIQHVHQDCLMEWLSHSQKKYCELCKTSFRFTKFYNPNMPQSLPVSVFFRQVLQYIIENSLDWLRAIVAATFWFVALPWFMRRGFSSMFWLSQESWGTSPTHVSSGSLASNNIHLSSTILGVDMCPSSPLFAPNTTPAQDIETMMGWWGSQTLSGFLLRCLCRITGMPVPSSVSTLHVLYPSEPRPVHLAPGDSQSLLSNNRILRQLTRSPTVNRAIISVLEGQFFTIVVIVSFILVILVRDYVVQQQPEINARGIFDIPDDAEPMPPVNVERPQPGAPGYLDDSDDEWLTDDGEPVYQYEMIAGVRHRRRMRAPRRAEPPGHDDTDAATASTSAHQPAQFAEHNATQGSSSGTGSGRPRSSDDDGSTDVVFTPDHSQSDAADAGSPNNEPKGKERVKSWEEIEWENQILPNYEPAPGGGLRPRSVSDGPQVQTNVNPLANNTWSFANSAFEEQSNIEPTLPPWNAGPVPSSYRDFPSQPPGLRNAETSGENGTSDSHRSTADQTSTNAHHEVPEPIHDDETAPAPEIPLSSAREPREPLPPHASVSDRVADFMWGDLANAEQDTLVGAPEPMGALGGEAHDPWADIEMEDHNDEDENQGLDPADPHVLGVDDDSSDDEAEVARGPAMDPEAVEDMEDFEGIMELLGMRGPITNLFQNVIFCAVLVQTALFACVFLPFNVGRITIWIMAKPARMVRILFELTKFMQDLCFIFAGFLSWTAFNLIDMVTRVLGGPIAAQVLQGRKGSWGFFIRASRRAIDFVTIESSMSGLWMTYWSAASRDALLSIKQNLSNWVGAIVDDVTTVFGSKNPVSILASAGTLLWNRLQTGLLDSGSWVIDLKPEEAQVFKATDGHWSAMDTTWAVLAGYVTVFAICALYLKAGIRVARGTALEDWETGVIDTLHQASGILKVITIISIEMLVFPLYCGLLLDCALLPLFAGATIKSRLLFTYNNPWTSLFVHWFVGTGYMFHFALFVSMCRKIMRPGVLYFIRDPDDPEFHPVRDVLERNLTTQLRKILFSAFVYGALVIVCLGGVVWGLAFIAPGVLPIHYSSNEPVLEFPVDLLFYNFFMPLAFRVFKPGDGLHAMYRWCFRKSARILRLTYFLFGERRVDEEGTLQLASNSPYQHSPAYRRLFLGLDTDTDNVVPKSWKDIIDGVDTRKSKSTVIELRRLRRKKNNLVQSGQIRQDGRFVRAPASDRVKIPKGRKVFLDVDERGRRLDGRNDVGLYASNQYQMVYVPPHLLTRIFLFILFIWTFAAVTGVGLTIIPLMLGRKMFQWAIPDYVRTNDIYAFCIGIHVLGVAAYLALHARSLWSKVRSWGKGQVGGLQKVGPSFAQAARVLYAYTFLVGVFPLVMSLLVELYINIPIHTYLDPPNHGIGMVSHTIRIMEAWTLGLLYMRLAVKMAHSFLRDTRFSRALRAVLNRGWFDPDVRVLTRAFVVPGLLLSTVAIVGPSVLVKWLEVYSVFTADKDPVIEAGKRAIRYRQAYPLVALVVVLARYSARLKTSFDLLKAQVRDDAYLMGERLQNYDGSPPNLVSAKIEKEMFAGPPPLDAQGVR